MDPTLAPALVLLVDDDPRNLVALEAILDGTGYRVLRATSGESALKLALTQAPTIILLDVVMPGMDGYEIARHLKAVERTRDIPILFLTALATDTEFIYRAYDVGAVDFMIKPLDPAVVRRKVGVFVQLVRQREQIERQGIALREADRLKSELAAAEVRMANDRRYRSLVEAIDHAFGWTMDEDLRLTFVSRQAPQLLGYPLAQLEAPGFWAGHVHPDDADTVLSTLRRAMSEGVGLSCNHRLIHADGRVLWFQTSVSGERGAGSHEPAKRLYGFSADFTEIKRAQEEAVRATRAREDLVGIVAHDLRNPLSAISTSAGVLEALSERVDDPGVQRGAQAIRSAVDHMGTIIDDLLDFAVIQAQHLTVSPDELDVADLLAEARMIFEPIAAERGVRLESHADHGLRVQGDRRRLLQTLSNLVGNAIKFTPTGGTVAVGATRADTAAIFTVADTGSGMTQDDASHIWERYWQAHKDSREGLGLGLSIARGIVEAHGGRIWASSAVGEGTTISFTIPLVLPAADRRAATRG